MNGPRSKARASSRAATQAGQASVAGWPWPLARASAARKCDRSTSTSPPRERRPSDRRPSLGRRAPNGGPRACAAARCGRPPRPTPARAGLPDPRGWSDAEPPPGRPTTRSPCGCRRRPGGRRQRPRPGRGAGRPRRRARAASAQRYRRMHINRNVSGTLRPSCLVTMRSKIDGIQVDIHGAAVPARCWLGADDRRLPRRRVRYLRRDLARPVAARSVRPGDHARYDHLAGAADLLCRHGCAAHQSRAGERRRLAADGLQHRPRRIDAAGDLRGGRRPVVAGGRGRGVARQPAVRPGSGPDPGRPPAHLSDRSPTRTTLAPRRRARGGRSRPQLPRADVRGRRTVGYDSRPHEPLRSSRQ